MIEREEANKNPNRGMGGVRSAANQSKIDRDDTNIDPYRKHRPDDVRKKWANKELEFDQLCGAPEVVPLCCVLSPLRAFRCSMHIGQEYIIQQNRRKYIRLGSIVAQARSLQKAVIANDNRRITLCAACALCAPLLPAHACVCLIDGCRGKLSDMARSCASALRHGNIPVVRKLLE